MSKKKIRLDFWNESFYKETAFGRTLSGRNKTGQTFGVVKDAALSTVPFIGKPLKEATGRITDELEAREIGKRAEELNLSPKVIIAIRALAVGAIGYLFISQVIGWDEAMKLMELFRESGLAGQ